jgi:hypothetical protein
MATKNSFELSNLKRDIKARKETKARKEARREARRIVNRDKEQDRQLTVAFHRAALDE